MGGQTIVEGEGLLAVLTIAEGFIHGSDFGMAAELGGGMEDVVLAESGTSTTGAESQDGVMGDVARRDLLASPVGALEEAQGNGQTVLDKLIGIIRTHHWDRFGDGRSESWDDFKEQARCCVRVHGRDLLRG